MPVISAQTERLGRIALLLGAMTWLCAAQALADSGVAARQRDAVALARTGDYAQAITALAQLRREAPDDLPLLYDETTVLAWAQRDREVLVNAQKIDPAGAPGYVVNAVAKSARNLREFETAADWYGALLRRAPADAQALAGYAMTLADAGRDAEARARLAPALAERVDSVSLRLASAYLHERDGAYLAAITDYEAVLRVEPRSVAALRGKALALRALLLPGEALSVANAHPGTLTDVEILHLEADELSVALRDAMQAPGGSAARARAIEPALANIERRLAQEAASSPIARRLRYDRLVALVESRLPAPAAADYRALHDENPEIPAYVHVAAGRAHLQLREPEHALAALERAAALVPGNVEIDMERFYAYAELEQYDEALALADGLVARLAAPGPAGQPDPARMRAEVLAGIGRAYADQLDASQRRLESLVAAAPHNSDARYELGNVYRWRGWSERALEEYGRVLANQPELLATRIGAAHAELDRQRFPAAEARLADAQASDARHGGVRSLGRRWELHNRNELLVEARWGESSGDTFGSDQYDVDAWWFSSPIRYNYRIFAHTYDSSADFENGNIHRRRAGAGLEYRRGPWTGRAETHFDRDGLDDPGLAAWLDRRLDDQWTVGALVELNSYSTPLRAYRDDIETDLFGLTAVYRRHESLRLGSGLRYQDFDDGNERWSFSGDGHWRWLSRPTYKLDFTGSLYGSTNSLDDAVYFNPERDFEGLLGIDQRWRMFRRYDRSLGHRVHGRAGFYEQKSFGSDLVWSLDYELTWSASDALELRLGWHRARRVYDGGAEYQTFYLAALHGRF
jgi:biofilm PGA synthesis protein PgaA